MYVTVNVYNCWLYRKRKSRSKFIHKLNLHREWERGQFHPLQHLCTFPLTAERFLLIAKLLCFTYAASFISESAAVVLAKHYRRRRHCHRDRRHHIHGILELLTWNQEVRRVLLEYVILSLRERYEK